MKNENWKRLPINVIFVKGTSDRNAKNSKFLHYFNFICVINCSTQKKIAASIAKFLPFFTFQMLTEQISKSFLPFRFVSLAK